MRNRLGTNTSRRRRIRTAAGVARSRRGVGANVHVVGARQRDAGADEPVLRELAQWNGKARGSTPRTNDGTRAGGEALRQGSPLLLGSVRASGPIAKSDLNLLAVSESQFEF